MKARRPQTPVRRQQGNALSFHATAAPPASDSLLASFLDDRDQTQPQIGPTPHRRPQSARGMRRPPIARQSKQEYRTHHQLTVSASSSYAHVTPSPPNSASLVEAAQHRPRIRMGRAMHPSSPPHHRPQTNTHSHTQSHPRHSFRSPSPSPLSATSSSSTVTTTTTTTAATPSSSMSLGMRERLELLENGFLEGSLSLSQLLGECKELLHVCSATAEPANTVRLCALVLRFPSQTSSQSRQHDVAFLCFRKLFELSQGTEHDTHVMHCVPVLLGICKKHEPLGARHISHLLAIVKNVSVDSQNQKRLVRLGAVECFVPMLAEGYSTERFQLTDPSQIANFLVEVTAILRNLAMVNSSHSLFFAQNVIPRLCALIPLYAHHPTLMLHVCRILGKLSLRQHCRAELGKRPETLVGLFELIPRYVQQTALALRVAYVLGNLTVTNDANRVVLFRDAQAVPTLLDVLDRLQRMADRLADRLEARAHELLRLSSPTAAGMTELTDMTKLMEDLEDVQAKVTRLAANLSANHEIGSAFAASPHVTVFVRVLLARQPASKHNVSGDTIPEEDRASEDTGEDEENHKEESGGGREEVKQETVMNAINAITNISFFTEARTGRPNALFDSQVQQDLTLALSPFLFATCHEELVVEVIRTLGNLSTDALFRAHMQRARTTDALALLLGHRSPEVVYAVCGVMMNLASDKQGGRAIFYKEECKALQQLVAVFVASSPDAERDTPWNPAMIDIICKLLLNLHVDNTQGWVPARALQAQLVHAIEATLQHPDIDPEHDASLVQVCERLSDFVWDCLNQTTGEQ